MNLVRLQTWPAYKDQVRRGGPLVGPWTAAQFLGVSRQHVYRLFDEGKLTQFNFLGLRLASLGQLERRAFALRALRSAQNHVGAEVELKHARLV